jgi:hypothetical protein
VHFPRGQKGGTPAAVRPTRLLTDTADTRRHRNRPKMMASSAEVGIKMVAVRSMAAEPPNNVSNMIAY